MNYEEIYLQTNYEVENQITFKLSNFNLYKDNNLFKKDFTIITAFNPENELLRCIENQDRNMQLKKEIVKQKYKFIYARGFLNDHSEDAFLILDINFDDSIKLGIKYEQYAIYYNSVEKGKSGYYNCKTKKEIVCKSL